MKFSVFTHVEHCEREGRYYAYAPYVREMNVWLKHVEKVEVVAPLPIAIGTGGEKSPCAHRGSFNGKAYQHSHLNFKRIPSFHFLNLRGAVSAIFKIPYIFFKIYSAMKRADHLHLRCPGNIGLLACICQIFFPSKPKSAKYAGNWDPEAKQPLSYRFQKWLLSNTFLTRNMKVLVYGEWPGQSKNVVSFFTASFSEKEKTEVPKKVFSEPFIFLFVGNLVEGKRPLEAIKFVEKLNFKLREDTHQEIRASYIPMKSELYGDGPEREKLEAYVRENHLEELISIKGNRSLEELKEAYQKAHFVILPSKSEGWPKALAEGMFFGCIPIATPVSCVPWILNYGNRGVLLQDLGQRLIANGQKFNRSGQRTKDRGQDVLKIAQSLADQEEMEEMSEEAKKWSQKYTLERFEKAIKNVLNKKKFNV